MDSGKANFGHHQQPVDFRHPPTDGPCLRRGGAILILLALMVLPALRAQTVFVPISNLSQPVEGECSGVRANQMVAMSFTTDDSWTALSGVSISMAGGVAGRNFRPGPFTVALYGDSSGIPGDYLMTLMGENYPTNAGVYTFTNQLPLPLLTNTTYWIVGSMSNLVGNGSYTYEFAGTSSTTLDAGSIWSLGAPAFDLADNGWAVNGGYNYEFSVMATTNLPTTPLISSWPTATAIVVGQFLVSSTLSDGAATNLAGAAVAGTFAFSSPLTVPEAGTTNELVIFTPTDTVDYYAATGSVPVMVTLNPSVMPLIASLPTAAAIGNGQSLVCSPLTGGWATNLAGEVVPGTFAFASPLTVPGIGTTGELVTFTPADLADYTTAATTVPVTTLPLTCVTNADGISISITGYVGSVGALAIPDTLDGLPVTSIGEGAFSVCRGLTNVLIGSDVTDIGMGAFAYCSGLTEVVIPNSVTSIDDAAFDDCGSLTTVTIGSGVTYIGIEAFDGFNQLESITVDTNNPAFCSVDGVLFNRSQTVIVDYPGGRAGDYTIPSTVTNIGFDAFADCAGLTGVIIPDSVTSIGDGAFIECTSLTTVTIPYGVGNINANTFAGCSSLVTVIIGGTVTGIGTQGGGHVGLPNGRPVSRAVTSLGSQVFLSCGNLTDVFFIGNAPTYEDPSVFEGDSNVTVFYLPGTTGWGATFDGVPAVLWNPHVPANDASFGVSTNGFGFNIAGVTNSTVVVEACTNIAKPVWLPVGTNILTGGSSYFSDPSMAIYPCRYYRFRSP